MAAAVIRVDPIASVNDGLPRLTGVPLGRALTDGEPVPALEGFANNVEVDNESSAVVVVVVSAVVVPDGVASGLAAPRQLFSCLPWSSLVTFSTVTGAQNSKSLHARSQLVSKPKGQTHSCCFLSMSAPIRLAKTSLLHVGEIALAMSAVHFWHLFKGTSAAAETEAETERIPSTANRKMGESGGSRAHG